MTLKNPLESAASQSIMSWAKWVSLFCSVAVILGYAINLGAITNTVENHSEILKRHEHAISTVWTRTEQGQFDNSMDKRLSYMEGRLNAIYELLLRQNNAPRP